MKILTPHSHEKIANFIRSSSILFLALFFLSGCNATASHYQYQYEPATENWSEYHYYPNVNVYYDRHRHIYHYQHNSRGWVSANRLPHFININSHRYNVVRSRHHRPWKNKHANKQHHKHYDHALKTMHQEHREQRHADYKHQIYYKGKTPHADRRVSSLRKKSIKHHGTSKATKTHRKVYKNEKAHAVKRKSKKQKSKKIKLARKKSYSKKKYAKKKFVKKEYTKKKYAKKKPVKKEDSKKNKLIHKKSSKLNRQQVRNEQREKNGRKRHES